MFSSSGNSGLGTYHYTRFYVIIRDRFFSIYYLLMYPHAWSRWPYYGPFPYRSFAIYSDEKMSQVK